MTLRLHSILYYPIVLNHLRSIFTSDVFTINEFGSKTVYHNPCFWKLETHSAKNDCVRKAYLIAF